MAKHSLDQLGSAWCFGQETSRNNLSHSCPECRTRVLFCTFPGQPGEECCQDSKFLHILATFTYVNTIRRDIQRLQSVGTEPRDPRNPSKKHWNSGEKESLLCRFNGASTVLCRCSKAWRADLMQASSESERIHKLTNSETN